jgi:LysM repeat protein
MRYFDKIQQAVDSINKINHDTLNRTEYDNIDYATSSKIRETALRILYRQRSMYKFLGLTKQQFDEILLNGKGNKRKVRHTITTIDTIFSIAKKYGVSAEDILTSNNLKASDIIVGKEIDIAINANITIQRNQEIAVFAEHRGEELLGRDIISNCAPDITGDIAVLQPQETLKQGIRNRLNTKQGEYPLNSSFGINYFKESQLPEDLTDNMIINQAKQTLESDPRISRIVNISLARNGNAIIIEADVETIL